MSGHRQSLEARFWAKVQKSDGCWEWTGALHQSGYGMIGLGSRQAGIDRAHRVSFRLHFSEIPEGLIVCHRCDNRRCVRPDHLFLGTHKDNSDDKWIKGRASTPPIHHGSSNPRAHIVAAFGVTKCIAEWAAETGIAATTIKQRLRRGWPAEDAVSRSA